MRVVLLSLPVSLALLASAHDAQNLYRRDPLDHSRRPARRHPLPAPTPNAYAAQDVLLHLAPRTISYEDLQVRQGLLDDLFPGTGDAGSGSSSGAGSGTGGGGGGGSAASSDAAAAASSSSASVSSASVASVSTASVASVSSASVASASRASASSAASLASESLAQASISSASAALSASLASISSASAAAASLSSLMSTSTAIVTQTAAPSASATNSSDSGSNNHTSLIVGVSVVAGVAVIAAIIFLWIKFGNKRFSGYDDDETDIKWPELKSDGDAAAMQPLPARRTGGAGFAMGDESEVGHGDEYMDSGVAGAGAGDMHEYEYGMKPGRESFTGSQTALSSAAPGYPVNAGVGGMGYGDPGAFPTQGYYDPYGAGGDPYGGAQQHGGYYQDHEGYAQQPYSDGASHQAAYAADPHAHMSSPYGDGAMRNPY